MEHKGDGDTMCNWNDLQRFGKAPERDHPSYRIFKAGQNTEKNPENWENLLLLRLQWITKQLTVVWTFRKG